MRFRLVVRAGLLVLATSGVARAARGQQASTNYSFGVAGGWALPKGVFGDGTRAGYALGAELLLLAPGAPVGLRFDGMFDHVAATPGLIDQLPTATNGSAWVGGLIVDAVVGTPKGTGFHPYALVGGGVYARHVSIDRASGTAVTFNEPFWGFTNYAVPASATSEGGMEERFGMNYGGGIAFGIPVVTFFAEIRYHIIYTSGEHTDLLPITVGIRF